MVDHPNDARIEVPQPQQRLTVNDVGDQRVCSDRLSQEADLGNRLLEKNQTTLGLINDAKVKYGDLPFEEGLVKALDVGKEDVAAEQKRIKDAGGNPPQLGKMLVDAGLVTQKQVDDAFAEQNRLKNEGKPSPRIGDILVQQLRDNIAVVLQQQNCRK